MKNAEWRHLIVGSKVQHLPSGEEYLVLGIQRDKQTQDVVKFSAYRILPGKHCIHPGVMKADAHFIEVTGNSEDWEAVAVVRRTVLDGGFIVRRAGTGEVVRDSSVPHGND